MSDRRFCMAVSTGRLTFYCSEPVEHDGPHLARWGHEAHGEVVWRGPWEDGRSALTALQEAMKWRSEDMLSDGHRFDGTREDLEVALRQYADQYLSLLADYENLFNRSAQATPS